MCDRATPIVYSCWIVLVAVPLSIGVAPPHLSTSPLLDAIDEPAPERTIIFPPLLAAYVTLDETATHILAVPKGEKEAIGNGLLRSYFPSLSSLSIVPTLGGKSAIPSDPEQALLLSPDRIVVWAWATGGLDKVGLPVTSIAQTDIAESWRAIGAVAQKPQRTEEILKSFEVRLKAIDEEISRLPSKARLRAIVLWSAGQNLWRLALGGNRHAQYLQRLGVEDLAYLFPGLPKSIGSTTIGVETLLELDPDVIFLACCASPDDRPQRFYESPYFHSLAAVRKNRIYKEPSGGTQMDGAIEWPLLMRWDAELLFPATLERKLRQQFSEVYQTFYGSSVSDDELDRSLRIEENAASFGYARFSRIADRGANP